MRGKRLRGAAAAVVLVVVAGCGGATPTTAGAPGSPTTPQGGDGGTTAAPVPTTMPCPTEAVVVTKPGNWTMVHDFSGQQVWEGIGTAMNPNPVTVALFGSQSFALTDVTLTNGNGFQAYTSNPTPVLPAGHDSNRPMILAGRTIELTYSIRLVRPTSIITTEVFAVAIPEDAPTFPTCFVPVSGAKPISAAPKGPRLCGQGDGLEAPEIKAVIGIPGPSDTPVCR